jgi:hypothetical protein
MDHGQRRLSGKPGFFYSVDFLIGKLCITLPRAKQKISLQLFIDMIVPEFLTRSRSRGQLNPHGQRDDTMAGGDGPRAIDNVQPAPPRRTGLSQQCLCSR